MSQFVVSDGRGQFCHRTAANVEHHSPAFIKEFLRRVAQHHLARRGTSRGRPSTRRCTRCCSRAACWTRGSSAATRSPTRRRGSRC